MNQKIKLKQTEIGEIPEDWNYDILSKHLYIKGRIGWKGLQKSEYLTDGSGIVIINGTQIQDNRLDWSDCGRVPEWRYDESPEIQLKENDIVMTKDGTIGKVAFIEKLPEKSSVASGIFVIRAKSGEIDQKFLFYFFKLPLFKWLIETRKEGSVIPHLYQRDFEELPFAYPNIQEQESIAKILSAIDSKIELNQQMNKTLEAIGQAIFKHWFIDFEFPNVEGKPYKSSGGETIDSELGEIPKEWKIISFDEVADLIHGYQFRHYDFTNEGVKVFKITQINDNGEIDLSSCDFVDRKRLSKFENIRIHSGDILMALTGATIGKYARYYEPEEEILQNYRVGKFISKNDAILSQDYLYFLISSINFLNTILSKQTQSAQQNIGKAEINNTLILLPPKKSMLQFSNIVSSYFKKIENNTHEFKTLIQIRDSLLPKLMSGKIRVPNEV
ncbi:MAG: restriction endonuclease subunit S [archaeon]